MIVSVLTRSMVSILFTLGLAAGVAAQLSGKVVSVYDGDTLTILDANGRQHKIRLAGIDSPEARQDFGRRAKQHLSSLVFGKAVTIEGSKIDRNSRRVGKVLINGRDANLEMLKVGLAWWYRDYQREQSERDRQLYAAAEDHARMERVGLWSIANPLSPWEYRHPTATRSTTALIASGSGAAIVGNRKSKIYHWPGCEGYSKVAELNRVPFKTRAEAEAAGYRAARNCK